MADVWTAAAQGQIGRIIELLTSDDPPVPEQLDGAGRTAAFYAQLNSHDGVARILQQRGWRMMEESELFNAGRGAVFTHAGTNEMDASIMDGRPDGLRNYTGGAGGATGRW